MVPELAVSSVAAAKDGGVDDEEASADRGNSNAGPNAPMPL